MPRTIPHDGDEATETVAVVIPTLNEERSIGKVIDDVPVADLLQNGLENAVYVIDGQSTDNTGGSPSKRVPNSYSKSGRERDRPFKRH
jgi:hypothetical protein